MIKFLKGLMKKKKAPAEEVPVPEKSEKSDSLKEMEEALKALQQLNEMLGGGMKIQSFDDYLKDSGSGQVVPFTTIENYNDAKKELSHHTKMYELLSDYDLVEELLSFHNKGYQFSGLTDIYKKLEKDEKLTQLERKNLEQMYLLVGMELVYNV